MAKNCTCSFRKSRIPRCGSTWCSWNPAHTGLSPGDNRWAISGRKKTMFYEVQWGWPKLQSRHNGQSQITSVQRKTKLHRHFSVHQACDTKLVPREAQVVSAGPVLVHIILGQPVSGIIANNSSSNSSQLYLSKSSVITVLFQQHRQFFCCV